MEEIQPFRPAPAAGRIVRAADLQREIQADPRKPLSRSLENQLLALCAQDAPYRIEALALDSGAPTTLAELLESTRGVAGPESGAGTLRHPDSRALIGERIPVWSGASSRSIWSRADVNILSRAWHDAHHILLCAEFDIAGDLACARYACSLIEGKPERAILWAEIAGQAFYFERWQAFPSDQRGFVRDCIRFGVERSVALGCYHRIGA